MDEEAAGDAAAYGIYFDDADYNYLQHLRPVGAQDSFLIEAPTKKGKGKGRKDEFEILLPEDALPSHPLDEISYTDITSGAAPVGGLQPDMDPKIREVLEALEDEAYAVDDGQGTDGEDDFWKDVVHGGEVDEDDWVEDDEDEDDEAGDVVDGADGFEARVARFKAQAKAHGSDDEDDMDSEGGDTIAALRVSNAKRPPRKGQSAAGSQFSMTSSAMFRNEGLRTLDDRFDQVRLSISPSIPPLITRYPRSRSCTRTTMTCHGESEPQTKRRMTQRMKRATLDPRKSVPRWNSAPTSTRSWTSSSLATKSSEARCGLSSSQRREEKEERGNWIGSGGSWRVWILERRRKERMRRCRRGGGKRRLSLLRWIGRRGRRGARSIGSGSTGRSLRRGGIARLSSVST